MLAVNATAADVVQLRETLASMERSFGDWTTFEQAARDFHRMLAVLTRSTTIKLLVEMLARITTVAEQRNSGDLAGTHAHRDAASASLRAHRKVVGLIAVGDADAAETLWRKHTSAGATHVLNSIAAGTVLDLFS
jgi:DNA-binding FadR family transcriptional regulator